MLNSRQPVAVHADSHTYTKTPGRNTFQGRNTLQENAPYYNHASRTIAAKGKAAHTPSHTRIAKSAFSNVKPIPTVSRPLGDKTPFPNRKTATLPLETPAPQATKLAGLSFVEPSVDAPLSVPRPSTARRSIRAPRTSGSAKHVPVTPVAQIQPQHWDISVGEVSIAEPAVEEVAQDDYDEIEYMPPKAIELQWQPDFDMPDYNVVGKTLLDLAQSYHFDDSADLYYAADIETQINVQELWKSSCGYSSPSRWERPQLPDLEDDSISNFQFTIPTSPTSSSVARSTTTRSMIPALAPAPSSTNRPIPYSLRPRPPSSTRGVQASSHGSSSARRATDKSGKKSAQNPTRSQQATAIHSHVPHDQVLVLKFDHNPAEIDDFEFDV